MSFQQRITDLTVAIAAKFNSLQLGLTGRSDGSLADLATSDKSSLVAALNEVRAAGAAGASAYEHTQASASASWIVNHNMGRRPAVSLLTVGGAQMIGSVTHISVNQVQIDFDDPTTGLALFN